jgi:two-component system OmpR family sensor kinase
LSPVDDTVHRLLYVEFGLFAFVVLIGAVASTGLVRWNLRPLNRVTAAALAVSNLPLATGSVELPERSRASEPGTEVGRVSAALDHMLDHIEAALQARNATEERLRRFIADASHELRTPLATIRSHAEYAQRMSDGLPAEVRHALTRVESESVRMGLLVDDLLLLAQLDAGRPLAREPVDLTRLVLDGVGDARVASPDHRWRLDLPESAVEVPGDEHRLHQVITNLLANARTHTPPGTTVTITLRTTARSATVEIADDGPGIPADLLPDLFGRFTRADAARSRRDGNTGLGLAIVYGIVMAHRGHVDVESRGGSTVFRIDLPASSRE